MSYDYDRRMKIARGEGMGAWDGQDHYWPEMHDWEFSGDSYDRFGDAYRGTYQYISRGGHYIDVFVHFDITGLPEKPGKWQASGAVGEKSGALRKVEDIPKVLDEALKWAAEGHKKVEKALEKAGGPKWDVNYDGYEWAADYKNTDRYSDASMTVTVNDIEDTIFRGKPGVAEIHFILGADYRGNYGEETERRPFRTVDDLNKVLKEAERLWGKWIQTPVRTDR